METTEKPLYKHDCDECVFLGNYKNKDLYFCRKTFTENKISLMVRNSNEPWDYFSMPLNVVKDLLLDGQLAQNFPFDTCYNRYIEYLNKN